MGLNLKFSIIMPVYNAEKYLKQSLSGFCNQSYKNIEIICIDDGSTDNSFDILKIFEKKDPRLKVIKQENAGPAKARQVGLDNAKGDYVWFVDADDSCEKEAIKKMASALDDCPFDILYFGVKLVQNEYNKHPSEDYYGLKNIPILRFNKNIKLQTDAFILFSLPRELWNKAYRREFLCKNNLKFDTSISLYDDILFTTKCLLKSTNIKISQDVLYHYHMNHSFSIMSTANNRLDGIFYYFDEIYKFIIENNYSPYVKRNWLCKEICSMNYWLTRKNINKFYYLQKLKKIYLKIKNEIFDLEPNNLYQLNNKKMAIKIVNKPLVLIYLSMLKK